MNSLAIGFLILNVGMLFLLPRRWAPLPLLIGVCYMTFGQYIVIGPFNFTVLRLLVAAGVVRVMIKRERLENGMNSLDWLILVWSAWALFTVILRDDPSAAIVFRLGLVYNTCGIYFLVRIFCQSVDDLVGLYRIIGVLLIPVAIFMLYEKMTGYNLFFEFGGVSEISSIREGKIRAQGPFAHSILAGTVGAVCLPMMIGLWPQHPKSAMTGLTACAAMIFASTSSGPIFSALAGIGALFMWYYRCKMRLARWLMAFGYIGLDLAMKAPVYYLIARFDAVGGSTGYHRAKLIESAFEHLSEWWLAGTDYTRHWMPTGVPWSEDHTDITNHYLNIGVTGGLLLMLMFISILAKGFSFVGQTLKQPNNLPLESQFMVWALGASLFAHTATCISVSYFDQSFIFLYLTLAAIGSIWSATNLPKVISIIEKIKTSSPD